MTGLVLCQTCDGTGRLYIQSKWHICGPCGGTGARIPGDPRGREITPANSSSFGRSQVKASTPPVRLRGIHDGQGFSFGPNHGVSCGARPNCGLAAVHGSPPYKLDRGLCGSRSHF